MSRRLHPVRRLQSIPVSLRKTPIDDLLKMSRESLITIAELPKEEASKYDDIELINYIKEREMIEVLATWNSKN